MLTHSVLYIALTGALIMLTSIYITVLRAKTSILHGDGDNDALARARRSHTAMIEFGVPFLVLVIAYDVTGGSAAWVMWLGIAFLVTRLSHLLYFYRFAGLHPTRAVGTVGTHAVNVILIVLILIEALG